jgi:hypothetical protein
MDGPEGQGKVFNGDKPVMVLNTFTLSNKRKSFAVASAGSWYLSIRSNYENFNINHLE